MSEKNNDEPAENDEKPTKPGFARGKRRKPKRPMTGLRHALAVFVLVDDEAL
jgi:hypothetical protein